MKNTGIIRQVDEMGRFVLPKELRSSFDINFKDSLVIYTEDDKIILKKYAPSCTFCGSEENNIMFNGKLVCKACIEKINKIKEAQDN
ncbi:MAG: AbrB/MazE/SpoVT family DNA-binding domain-containing protein [Clostridia bacterium]|nr:AbrB/MazE/SpoVT family DNA-binding domain-containing protein [Clostridia bacterium]